LKIVPISESLSETDQVYHFEKGQIYLYDKKEGEGHMDIFADQVKHNIQGLCVTRKFPGKIREKYGLEKTPIIWLTGSESVPGENCIKPDNLTGLTATLNKFLAEANDGLIMLDGIEYLIARNSYESVLKFIHYLNDRIMTSKSRVMVCIDPLTLDQKHYHLMKSEMSTFEEEPVIRK
jgi:hypothetical protein